MFLNNLKIAFRKIAKHKMESFIHLLGLTLGLSCCLLIGQFIAFEWSYDDYHQHRDQIYRVNSISQTENRTSFSINTPYPLGEALRTDFPDIPAISRSHYQGEVQIEVDPRHRYKVDQVFFVEAQLLDIFDFEILHGDGARTLAAPNQVILSEQTAHQLFGDAQALGKTFRLDNMMDLEVGAIMKDPPANSHLQANLLVSFESFTAEYFGFPLDKWGMNLSGVTYMRLAENQSVSQLDAQLTDYLYKFVPEDKAERQSFLLQPLSDFHFAADFSGDGASQPISPLYLWLFGIIGLLILLIACINFINLSTVQAMQRGREIGVRKVIGARRKQLIWQYLSEAWLLTGIAGLIALALTETFGGPLAQYLGRNMGPSLTTNGTFLILYTGGLWLVGLMAGLYPAFILSQFRPVQVLKGQSGGRNRNGLWMRRGLIVTQFAISLILLIGTLIVSGQLDYLRTKELGFNEEATILMDINEELDRERFRNELLREPLIQSVSYSIGAPTSENDIHTSLYQKAGEEENALSVSIKPVDHFYLETHELSLIAGRWFREADAKYTYLDIPREERQYFFVLNETLCKTLGYLNPADALGKKLHIGINSMEAEVIGVIRDFHSASLHEAIEPMVLFNFPRLYFRAGVRLEAGNWQQAISHIEQVWESQVPGRMFEYEFLDENLAELYESESNLFKLFQMFTGLALLIACLGLWGMVSYTTQLRRKEIGVRKVVGATSGDIIILLSREFSLLLLIAFAIAIPISLWGALVWLQNFSYAIHPSWLTFLTAGLMAMGIAMLALSYQSIRAALANPVNSIQHSA